MWKALANRARRRGAVLLECLLALALFVACGLTVMGMMDRAVASVAATRDAEAAVDLARSAMAQIEAGIATPETLNGPVPRWRRADDASFDDSPQTSEEWTLEIETEPSQFEGLTKVSIRAVRLSPSGQQELASYTLHQLVRLSGFVERTGGVGP